MRHIVAAKCGKIAFGNFALVSKKQAGDIQIALASKNLSGGYTESVALASPTPPNFPAKPPTKNWIVNDSNTCVIINHEKILQQPRMESVQRKLFDIC